MKYIISTTGEKISFALNGKRKLVIDPIVPTEVSDEELTFILSRLGMQIRSVSPSPEQPKKEVEEAEEEEVSEDTEE